MATSQARIIPLPSAAASPVVQHPRRGRFPKKVIWFWTGKARVQQKREADPRWQALRAAEAAAERSLYWADRFRHDAAALRQQLNLSAKGI